MIQYQVVVVPQDVAKELRAVAVYMDRVVISTK
jgi:hypothetical protein